MKFKWILIWIVLHTISVVLVSYLVDIVNIQNSFLVLLITGFGVTFLANVYRTFTHKKQFVLNSLFALYIVLNSVTIWIFTLIKNEFDISNFLLNSIFIAVGLVVASYLVNYLSLWKLKGFKILTLIVVLIAILYFTHGNLTTESTITKSDNSSLSIGNKIDNFIESIKSIFAKTLEPNCPQINVQMEEPGSFSLYSHSLEPTIQGKTYDGWTVKGEATCRKGSKEGENLKYYYCGGYLSILGIGRVNAYVQKTIISDNGDIGKTYKYVIWNVYDENKQFVETKCLGDPDEFEKKQAEAFEKEMLKWN